MFEVYMRHGRSLPGTSCKPNIGSIIFLAHFDWHYYQVGRQLLGRSCDHEHLDLLRCRLSVIYIIFSTIGLELWTTGYRLPDMESALQIDLTTRRPTYVLCLGDEGQGRQGEGQGLQGERQVRHGIQQ